MSLLSCSFPILISASPSFINIQPHFVLKNCNRYNLIQYPSRKFAQFPHPTTWRTLHPRIRALRRGSGGAPIFLCCNNPRSLRSEPPPLPRSIFHPLLSRFFQLRCVRAVSSSRDLELRWRYRLIFYREIRAVGHRGSGNFCPRDLPPPSPPRLIMEMQFTVLFLEIL